MLRHVILKYKELSSVNSKELILGSEPQETGRPQRRDIISSTAGNLVYGYVGLQTKGTPKASETVCLVTVNS